MSVLEAGGHPSPLQSQLQCKTQDLDWTLAHFTFVANVTTLSTVCDIAHSPAMSVASCRALPRLGLAFVGDSSELLATYATFLADPGSEVSLLVNEQQRKTVESAFDVESIAPRWQMLYRGDADGLVAGQASELVDNDFSAAQALARSEKKSLTLLSNEPFEQGPAFGIWERRRLVAMGMTTLCLPGVAQIDNVITRKEYSYRGFATQVVAALLLAHLAEERNVFSIVDQSDKEAVELYEKLGFTRERPMYAMFCVLRARA